MHRGWGRTRTPHHVVEAAAVISDFQVHGLDYPAREWGGRSARGIEAPDPIAAVVSVKVGVLVEGAAGDRAARLGGGAVPVSEQGVLVVLEAWVEARR